MNNYSERLELLAALKWYFESKNLALRAALSMRPSTVHELADLRVHYSQYFVSLGSAVELLAEKGRPGAGGFKQILHRHLARERDEQHGRAVYLYVRELRNAIVHRGFDVTGSAHYAGDVPMYVLPQILKDRCEKLSYSAPVSYVLPLVILCESAAGPAAREYLSEAGLLEPEGDRNTLAADATQRIQASPGMPPYIQAAALQAVSHIDHEQVERSFLEGLLQALRPQRVGEH